MAGGSTLDPDNFTTSGTVRNRTHTTGALGPSDLSDTGSDTVGGPGLLDAEDIGLDRGTNEDSEGGSLDATAGASIGDLDLDSDTDSGGSGERMGAGMDPDVGVGSDVGFDRIVDAAEAGLGGGLDQAEEARLGITDAELAAAADEVDGDDDPSDPAGLGQMSDDDALLDQEAAQDGVEAGYGDGNETRGSR